jgi:hypothetical protein
MELKKPMPALENARQEHFAQELAKGKPAQTPTTLQVDGRDEKGRFLPGNSGNGGRPLGSRNKLAQFAFDMLLKVATEGGETSLRELQNKDPGKFWSLIIATVPHQFRHEVEHTIAGLSADEVRARLAESRAKLLEAGVDLEALPVVEALPAPESKSGEG